LDLAFGLYQALGSLFSLRGDNQNSEFDIVIDYQHKISKFSEACKCFMLCYAQQSSSFSAMWTVIDEAKLY
jgi:hypothetical protein